MIPGDLRARGFSVSFDCVRDDPTRRLWCAKASREGKEWIAHAESLSTVLLELEKLTQETVEASGRAPCDFLP